MIKGHALLSPPSSCLTNLAAICSHKEVSEACVPQQVQRRTGCCQRTAQPREHSWSLVCLSLALREMGRNPSRTGCTEHSMSTLPKEGAADWVDALFKAHVIHSPPCPLICTADTAWLTQQGFFEPRCACRADNTENNTSSKLLQFIDLERNIVKAHDHLHFFHLYTCSYLRTFPALILPARFCFFSAINLHTFILSS